MTQAVIAFRTKANNTVGFGHLRRCLTLAKVFRKKHYSIHFIINDDINAKKLLAANDFPFAVISESDELTLIETSSYLKQIPTALLIVDTYAINKIQLIGYQWPTVLITDCDEQGFLVDVAANQLEDIILSGIDYVLLDEIFSSASKRLLKANIKQILITLGGTDPVGLTTYLIQWASEVLFNIHVDVVIGPFFTNEITTQIQKLAQENNHITLHYAPETLYHLMMQCDLALTGAGQTLYELARTGTPAIAIQVADNQICNIKRLANETFYWAGNKNDKNLAANVKQAIQTLSTDFSKRAALSFRGMQLIDGLGAERTAKKIMDLIKENK